METFQDIYLMIHWEVMFHVGLSVSGEQRL